MRSNKPFWLIFVILCIPMLGCSWLYQLPEGNQGSDRATPASAEPISTPITTAYGEGVIFSATLSEEQAVGMWASSNPDAEYWTPSEADVLAFEAGLPTFLAESDNQMLQYEESVELPIWGHLNEYYRQYIGLLEDRRQVLYGNFFCNLDYREDYWLTGLVVVMDGGNCYFQVKFDVDTHEYFQLAVNGIA